MRFSDYLRATVLLLASSSFALLVAAAVAIAHERNSVALAFTVGWVSIALVIGLWFGRGDATLESIRALLSRSRSEPIFPQIEPTAILYVRLWPAMLVVLLSGVASVWLPSVPGATAGYALLWALAWRKQAGAIEAIEDRDAVHFWIVRTPPWRQLKIVRVPAM